MRSIFSWITLSLAAAAILAGSTAATAEPFDAAALSPCVADATSLCLSGNRFKVQVDWQALNLNPIQSGQGQAVAITGDTGYFWFFGASSIELVVKIVDGRAVNQNFWVFYGGLSNVQYAITVADTQTGAVQKYFNVQGSQASVSDTAAFRDSFTSGPTALFTAATTTPAAGASDLFTDTSRGNPTQWAWDFGDNTPFDLRQNPSHVFAHPGSYSVSLTVRNGESSDKATETINVGASGAQPEAIFAVLPGAIAGVATTFQDQSTNAPTAWLWNFGDPASGSDNTSVLKNPTHTFAAPGTYTVTEIASNNSGTSAPFTQSVTVASGTPAAETIEVDVRSFDFNQGNPIVLHVGHTYRLRFHTLDNGSSGDGHGFSGISELGLKSHRPLTRGVDYTTETFTPTTAQIGNHFFECNSMPSCGAGHSSMNLAVVIQQ